MTAAPFAFDPFDEATRRDPYAIYARARREQPLFAHDGLPVFSLFRHADVQGVLKDPSTWSNYFPPPPDMTPDDFPPSMLSSDPPQDTRLRGLVSQAFTPRIVQRDRPASRRRGRQMRRILGEAERLLAPRAGAEGENVEAMVAHAACEMAERTAARAIVVPTRSGFTARQVSSHRPRVPIVALTPDEAVRRRLSLVWGVTAVTVPWYTDIEAVLAGFRAPVRATGLVPDGAPVIVTAGYPFARPGVTNLVHVTRL